MGVTAGATDLASDEGAGVKAGPDEAADLGVMWVGAWPVSTMYEYFGFQKHRL